MITHHIPLISSTAGDLSDGSIIGSVNQSSPVAVLQGESLVAIAQVLIKDITATGSTSTITGTSVTYAGGGGGGALSTGTGGTGGTGGGGNGSNTGAGSAGTTKLGGGGGGGASLSSAGGTGGSGVVIIRFATQSRSYQALASYANDAAAAVGNILIGQFYRNSTSGATTQRAV